MASSGVWQTVCVHVMASPDVAQFPAAWLLIRGSGAAERRSGAAQGHAAPLMLALQALYFFWYSHCSCRTRSHPRLNVKTLVGLFPCKIKTAHAACGLYLVGADLRLTDGLAVTHTSTCCFFSNGNERSEWSFIAKQSSDLCAACGEADLNHNIQHKAIGRLQAASRSVSNMAARHSFWQTLYSVHQSGGGQRSLTCFLLITSLVLYLPTADWPELSLNPEASSSKAPSDWIKLTD